MRPSNRLRWRLTLLYTVITLISGVVLLGLVNGVAVSVSSDGRARTAILDPPYAPDPPVPPARGDRPVEPAAVPPDGRSEDHVLLVPGVALLLMAPLLLGFGWFISGRMLRPVRTMTGTLRRISGRNVHERLAVGGPRDEFKDLADTIDGLLGRLETALDGHKRFVANAAHELRTPLTVEHALLEEPMLDPDATAAAYRASFEQLLAVNRHRAALLESLLTLAASESAREGGDPVDLDAVADAALRERAGELERHGLRAEVRLRPARVLGDATLIARLVANLCDNAVHYNAPGGTVEVSARSIDGYVRLVVSNTGPVVPADQVARMFEPFQRLHRVADDGHHGLGLSIVRAIAVAHGARVTAEARTGGGLTVEVLFPG